MCENGTKLKYLTFHQDKHRLFIFKKTEFWKTVVENLTEGTCFMTNRQIDNRQASRYHCGPYIK